MEFLLSQGADANKANKDGMLPLHIASKKGNYRSAGARPPPLGASPPPPRRGSGGRERPAHGTRGAQEGSGWRAPSRWKGGDSPVAGKLARVARLTFFTL